VDTPFGRPFCVDRFTPFTVCIPNSWWKAWQDYETTVRQESDATLSELMRDALGDFLRSIGKLPAPYV
jgi:hypothetical protein